MDLENMMANIHENPDLSAIEKMVGNEEAPVESAVKDDAPASVTTEKEAVVEPSNDEPTGIESKNGKHVLPYNVLATERERRQTAEQNLQAMQQRLADLEKGRSTPNETAQETSDLEIDPELEADFPAVAKAMKAMQAQIKSYESRFEQIQNAENQRSRDQQATVQKTVQETIDENPVLSHWQNNEPEMFDAAVKIDEMLMSDPRTSHLSLADRFAKAVASVEAIHGKAELPGAKTVEAPPKADDKELQKRAAEAAAKATETAKPRTLSDLPGGVAPVTDDTMIENMSATEISAMLAGKTPDQIAEFIARFG